MKEKLNKHRAWIAILTICVILVVVVITVPAFKFQDRLRGLLQRVELLPAPLPEYVVPIAPADRVSARRLVVASLQEAQNNDDFAEIARINAILSQEAFQRAYRTMRAWEAERDPQNSLIPYATSYGYAYWNGKDNAADLFSHLLIAGLYLDEESASLWLDTFQSEAELCGEMSCRVDLEKNTLIETDLDSRIFDSSEYAKDGLLPMVERFGPGPWLERLQTITDAILEAAYVDTPYGKLPSVGTEVNGEMLQVLTRLYWMTGKESYLEMAERLAEAYFFEILPNNKGLPADYWDFENQRPFQEDERFRPAAEGSQEHHPFRIVDHGGEIIPGLAELYYLEKMLGRPQAERYHQPMQDILDLLLVTGRTPEGLWYNSVDVNSGDPLDTNLADTWGYLVNAYKTFDLAEGSNRYGDEIERAMHAAAQQHSIQWELDWQDGYADAIESMIYLLPWYNAPEYQGWVDDEIEVLFLKQKDDGFLENWYLDGNFVRTALLYGFYKTKGVRVTPWREDFQLGAAHDEKRDILHIYMTAEQNWDGRLIFDAPRHQTIWKITSEYPRLNQLPEWYTINSESDYLLTTDSGETFTFSGQDLIDGIPWQLNAPKGQFLQLIEIQ